MSRFRQARLASSVRKPAPRVCSIHPHASAKPVVNVSNAKALLSRLISQIECGEEVLVARYGKPVAKLGAYRPRGPRRFGALRDHISIGDHFFDPLPEEELAAWDR